jgi:hypothetical protein
MGNHVILFSFDYLGNHVVDKFWEVSWIVFIWLVYKELFVTLRNTFIFVQSYDMNTKFVRIKVLILEKAFWFLNSFGYSLCVVHGGIMVRFA